MQLALALCKNQSLRAARPFCCEVRNPTPQTRFSPLAFSNPKDTLKEWNIPEHYGAERHEMAEAQAEGMVREELKRRHWREGDLGRRAKGDAVIPKDSAAGRRQFELRLEERRQQEAPASAWKPIRRGWYFGDETFRRELLERIQRQWGEHHSGTERQESDEQKAERIIQAGLAKAGWREEDLPRRRKSDPLKLRLAAQLRRETPMTLKWIAARLKMGTWKHLNRRLHEHGKLIEREKCQR